MKGLLLPRGLDKRLSSTAFHNRDTLELPKYLSEKPHISKNPLLVKQIRCKITLNFAMQRYK